MAFSRREDGTGKAMPGSGNLQWLEPMTLLCFGNAWQAEIGSHEGQDMVSKRNVTVWSFAAVLSLSLVANAVLGGSYYNLKKHRAVKKYGQPKLSEPFSDYAAFAARAYGEMSPGRYVAETGIVGGVPVLSEKMAAWLETAPSVSHDAQGEAELFEWFWNNRRPGAAEAFAGTYGSEAQPDHIFCDQAVAMFRALLMTRGFRSRVVVFEYADGHGGNSHTFVEAWDPVRKQWFYVDPFYGAYGIGINAGDFRRATDTSDITFLPPRFLRDLSSEARRQVLKRLFSTGAEHVYIESVGPLRRIEFIANKP